MIRPFWLLAIIPYVEDSAKRSVAFVINKMASADDSVFESSLFKFIIDGNLLYIHAGLIALHSTPLNRMINGHMSEAQKGYAELHDVDKATFVRFIRWAYTGTYSAAEFRSDPSPTSNKASQKAIKKGKKGKWPVQELFPEVTTEDPMTTDVAVSIVEEPMLEEAPAATTEFDVWGGWNKFTAHQSRINMNLSSHHGKQDMRKSFINCKYDVPATTFSTAPPRSNQGPLEDYSEVFLSHARVYIFADKYDIESLKQLALQNLHQTLAIYTLYPERCRDIIALIRYSYTHTADRGERVDGLRALLTHYMGIEMAILAQDEGFKTLLLEEEGAVLGDFLKMVTQRVE